MPPARPLVVALLAAAGLVAGCASSEAPPAASEPPGRAWRLEVVRAELPRRQALAAPVTLSLTVRNADRAPAPAVAVTVETSPDDPDDAPVAFSRAADDPGLADARRPVWIVDAAPAQGAVAHTNTWALGRLGPGERRTLTWQLTPVMPGRFTLAYRVAPSLTGRARAVGPRARGELRVRVARRPSHSRVGAGGEVVREGR